MAIHLTKEELQECQRASWEGEESTTKAGEYLVWLDHDSRGHIILHYDDGNDTPYLQSEDKLPVTEEMSKGKYTFLEGMDFEPYDWPYGISLSISELEAVDRGRGQDYLTGWSLETHTDDGTYDGGKGAMTDFKCSLYNEDGDYMGTGEGDNYYTAVSGVHFYGGIDFVKEPDPLPSTEAELFNDKVINTIENVESIKTKIWEMKRIINEYESSL